MTYGPGGYWPERTPAWDTTPVATVSSMAELQSALAAHAADPGDVAIWLGPGSYSGVLPQITGMSGRSANVLIRPADPDGMAVDWDVSCDNVTLAGFIGAFYLRSNGPAMARHTIRQTASNFVTGQNVQLVDVVGRRRWSTSSDRMQIKDTAANVTIKGWWVEGPDDDGTGGHTDDIQVIALAGYLRISNAYIGGGGNTASLSVIPVAPGLEVTLTDVWVAHSQQGTGDTMIRLTTDPNNSITLTRVRSDGGINFRFGYSGSWPPAEPISLTDVRAARCKWVDSSGAGHSITPDGLTIDTTLTPPSLSRPAWWSDLREAA